MAINLNQQNPNNPQGQQQGSQAAGAANTFKPKTTGFTNLKSVLNANKDNKLASTVGQGVQNITNKTQNQTQQAQQQFQTALNPAQQDVAKGQQVQQKLSNLDFSKDSDAASQSIADVGSDEYVNASKNLRAGYQGPQGLENQEQLQSQAQQLGQTAQGLLTSGGRQAALQRFLGAGPNYTQGKQQLDSMLLGQDNGAINQARRQAAQTAQGTNEAINQASTQGQYIGQQFNTLGQDITGKTQALGSNLGTALDTRAQTMNADANKQLADLQTGLQNGSVSPEQYEFIKNQILGGTENTYNMTKDQIAGQASANNQNTADMVAKQKEVQARDILSRLAGLDNGDALLNLDESLAETGKGGLSGNLEPYNTQKAAADTAMNDFKYNAAAPGYQSFFDKYINQAGNTYKAAEQIFDPYINKGKTLDNPALVKSLLDVQNTVEGSGLVPVYGGGMGERPIYDLYKQYDNTNKTYGLGNSLAQLLAKNNTFGVK